MDDIFEWFNTKKFNVEDFTSEQNFPTNKTKEIVTSNGLFFICYGQNHRNRQNWQIDKMNERLSLVKRDHIGNGRT